MVLMWSKQAAAITLALLWAEIVAAIRIE